MITSSSDFPAAGPTEPAETRGRVARWMGLPGRAFEVVRRNRLLAVVCLVGLLLGGYGGWWGAVEPWNPDQMALLPLGGEGLGPFEPHSQLKPPFHTYLNVLTSEVPAKAVRKAWEAVSDTPFHLHIAKLYFARLTQLLLFIGIALVACRVVTRASGRTAGLITAVLVVTCAAFVVQAHYLTADIPVAFWMVLAFCFAQSMMVHGRWRDYLLAGLVTGLATATKYNGLAVGLAIPAFHWLAHTDRSFLRMALDKRYLLTLAVVPVGFVIGNPYALLSLERFTQDFHYNYVTTQVYTGQDAAGTSYGLFFMHLLTIFGPLLAATVFVGLVMSVATARRSARLSWATSVAALAVFVLYLYKFGGMPRLEERFVFPVTPMLLIAAAPGWSALASRQPRTTVSAVGVVACYGVLVSLWAGHQFASDPRMRAQAWGQAHFVEGDVVETTYYAPNWYRLPGVKARQSGFPGISGRLALFERMFADDPELLALVRSKESNDRLDFYSLEALSERRPEYIAVNSLYYDRFIDSPKKDLYPQVQAYFTDLLAERAGYTIVFDERNPPPPGWLITPAINFMDNRMVILKRDDPADAAFNVSP